MRKSSLQEELKRGDDLGKIGENLAVEHLKKLGFKIVDRNVRYKTGEIDIIAKKRNELHFMEVKTRKDPGFLPPIEVVTQVKQRHMRKTAEMYLNDARNNFKYVELPPCFFGVIGVDFVDGKPNIECILDAFI